MPPGDQDEREWQTRRDRIDTRLTAWGWSVVSRDHACGHGVEAITEYETDAGPADYALSIDGRVLGVVEAKRLSLGPQNALTQAERYSRGIAGSPFDYHGFRVPFLYSTNGEVIWFHDVRHPLNRSRKIADFHTPQALQELLDRNILCLCPNHHVLFDRGAIAVADDMTIIGAADSSRLRMTPEHQLDLDCIRYHRGHYTHADPTGDRLLK